MIAEYLRPATKRETVAMLARRHGVSRAHVYVLLKANGVTPRSKAARQAGA